MELKLAQAIVEAVEDMGDEATVCEDYSGRGMYGASTAGVVVPSVGVVLTAVIARAHLFVDQTGCPLFDEGDHFSTDNMGRDMIIY